jgi:hypothetical protein
LNNPKNYNECLSESDTVTLECMEFILRGGMILNLFFSPMICLKSD